MKLHEINERIRKYKERLKQGKANKVKEEHVEAVIAKLNKKHEKVSAQLEKAGTQKKQDRLQKKLETINSQIKRAKRLNERLFAES